MFFSVENHVNVSYMSQIEPIFWTNYLKLDHCWQLYRSSLPISEAPASVLKMLQV